MKTVQRHPVTFLNGIADMTQQTPVNTKIKNTLNYPINSTDHDSLQFKNPHMTTGMDIHKDSNDCALDALCSPMEPLR